MKKGDKVIGQEAHGNKLIKGLYVGKCIGSDTIHWIQTENGKKAFITQPRKL